MYLENGPMAFEFCNAMLRESARFLNRDLFDTMAERMARAYPRTLAAWDEVHGAGAEKIVWTPGVEFNVVRLARDMCLYALLPGMYYKVVESFSVVSVLFLFI